MVFLPGLTHIAWCTDATVLSPNINGQQQSAIHENTPNTKITERFSGKNGLRWNEDTCGETRDHITTFDCFCFCLKYPKAPKHYLIQFSGQAGLRHTPHIWKISLQKSGNLVYVSHQWLNVYWYLVKRSCKFGSSTSLWLLC